jgi:hypothetical protein
MNRKLFLTGFVMLFTCAAFAQDSTMKGITKQHHTTTHKKSMHNSTSTGTMPADSVNAGKITTNPNGKMTTKRKTSKSSMTSSSSKDSPR